jgi:hypothetical protein
MPRPDSAKPAQPRCPFSWQQTVARSLGLGAVRKTA